MLERTEDEIFIFIGNFACEGYWKESTDFTFHRIRNKEVEIAITYSDLFMVYLCKEQDLLILGQEISPDYVEYLKEITIAFPETVIVDRKSRGSLTENILEDNCSLKRIRQYVEQEMACGHRVYLIPFAVTYLEERLAEAINVPLKFANSTISKQLNNKFYVRELCRQLSIPVTTGKIIQNLNEMDSLCADLFQNFDKVVLKEPYGASGLGMMVLKQQDVYSLIGYIANKLCEQKASLLIEGWYEVKESINQQYMIERGKISFLCGSKQEIKNGLYKGSYSKGEGEQRVDIFCDKIETLLNRIKKLGYEGVIGIDSILCSTGESFPCIEINARFNMSTFVFALRKRLEITSNVFHFWEDIIISRDSEFNQIRCMLAEREFQVGDKKGIIYFNFIITSITAIKKNCRIHFLIIGEDDDYIQSTAYWVKEILNNGRYL